MSNELCQQIEELVERAIAEDVSISELRQAVFDKFIEVDIRMSGEAG